MQVRMKLRTRCLLSLQLSNKHLERAVSRLVHGKQYFCNKHNKTNINKTRVVFWIGTGKTEQATGVEDNLNLSKSLMTLFDY